MTQTLTLTLETLTAARVVLLHDASIKADRTLEYVELGWHDCAATSAMLAYRYSRAWHELAHPSN